MPVIFSPEAIADLAEIRTYIGDRNPAAASHVAGRPGLVPGTRELTLIWPYVVIYRIGPEAVEIVRIWHGAQDRHR